MNFSDEKRENLVEDSMTDTEYKACANLISKIKRCQNVSPFLKPVDPIALGIPEYFEKIKNPMDISTIKTKLDSKTYTKLSEFNDDFNLMFNNCYSFNQPDSYVYNMGKDLQKSYLNLYNDIITKTKTDGKKKVKISESTEERPKRVVSPLAMNIDDHEQCLNILIELEKSKNRKATWPFLFPVTEEDAPGYFEIIKYPIDLSTIRAKLESKTYASTAEFFGDLKLITQNCFKYNPKETEVYKCGEELCRLIAGLQSNDVKDVDGRIAELRKTISLLSQELEQLERQSKNVVYSLAERERIGLAIKHLNPSYLKGLEKIIYRACAYEFIDTDEIVVNLQTIKDDVLAEIDEYIKKTESGNYAETDSVSDE